MGYGYMALATKSEHDNYLVGNPQFTYFKGVYKRHTNFSTSFNEVLFQQDTEECWGKKIYIKVPKEGDLIHRGYLSFDIEMDSIAGGGGGTGDFINRPRGYAPFAYSLIEYIDLYIGDQLIDRHYAEWLYMYHELFEKSSKQFSLRDMVSLNKATHTTSGAQVYTFNIPLRFWFNNTIGLSLPIIALQYSEVKFEIKMRKRTNDVTMGGAATIPSWGLTTYVDHQGEDPIFKLKKVSLLLENFYLDKEERRMFTTNKHEYLITQVQQGLEKIIGSAVDQRSDAVGITYPLHFRYPVKEIIWRIQNTSAGDIVNEYKYGRYHYNYWQDFIEGGDQMYMCKFVINNTTIADLPSFFYRNIQSYQHHECAGADNVTPGYLTGGTDIMPQSSGLYMYSFALNPGDHQPSGTLNFSKVENASLKIKLMPLPPSTRDASGIMKERKRRVIAYALNYNVFRIMSGLGALAFVN